MTDEGRQNCAHICMMLIHLLKMNGIDKKRVRTLSMLAAAFTAEAAEHRYTLLCVFLRRLEMDIRHDRMKRLVRYASLAMPDFTTDFTTPGDQMALDTFFRKARQEMN